MLVCVFSVVYSRHSQNQKRLQVHKNIILFQILFVLLWRIFKHIKYEDNIIKIRRIGFWRIWNLACRFESSNRIGYINHKNHFGDSVNANITRYPGTVVTTLISAVNIHPRFPLNRKLSFIGYYNRNITLRLSAYTYCEQANYRCHWYYALGKNQKCCLYDL